MTSLFVLLVFNFIFFEFFFHYTCSELFPKLLRTKMIKVSLIVLKISSP